jgi:hypothetical protein
VKRRKVALMVLIMMMVGACYAAAAPIVVTPGVPVSLYGFLNSLFGTGVALCDPVPGSGSSGGD